MPERAFIPRDDCAEVQLVLCDPYPEYAPQVASAARGSDIIVFDDTGSSPGEREMMASGLYRLANGQMFSWLDPLDQEELKEHAGQELSTATALALREKYNANIGIDLVGMGSDNPESICLIEERHARECYVSLLASLGRANDLVSAKAQHLHARRASDALNQDIIAKQLAELAAWCEGYSPRRITAVLGLGYAAVGTLLQESNIATDTQEFRPADGLSYDEQLLASPSNAGDSADVLLLSRAAVLDMALCAMSAENKDLSPTDRRTLYNQTSSRIGQIDDAGISEILGRWDIIVQQNQPTDIKYMLLARMVHNFNL